MIELLDVSNYRRYHLIEYLHVIQDNKGHINDEFMAALANLLGISQTEVYEVATFYHHFDVVKEDQIPPPPLTVRICESVSCEMAGAKILRKNLKALFQEYSKGFEKIRLQAVPCVGRSQHAPIAVVGKNPIDRATPQLVNKCI